MKHLICLVLLLSLTGCYEEAQEKKGSGNTGMDDGLQDVTDYTRCNSAGPTPKSVEGTWSSAGRSDDGVLFQFLWTFVNNRLYVSNTCSYSGRKLTTRVMVPAEYTNNYVAALGSASNSTEINDPDFQMSCPVNVEEFAANYYFNGRCLVLQINGYDKPVTLIPGQ